MIQVPLYDTTLPLSPPASYLHMQSADKFSSTINTQQARPPPEPTQPANSVYFPNTPSPTSAHPLASTQQQDTMAAAAVSAAPSGVHDAQQPHHEEQRQDMPRPYKCPLCEKAFHRLEHQTRHIRTHTGEKPHACQFPGCQKRFSRSDELTRHSRIHSNPNSRRGKATTNVHATLAFGGPPHPGYTIDGQPYMLAAPQPIQYPNTAPNSQLASPNVSPPHSYVHYATPAAYQTPPSYGSSYSRSGFESPNFMPPPQAQTASERGINLLATAASQVEVERQRQSAAPPSAFHPTRSHRHHVPHHHPYSHHGSGTHTPSSSRLPSLSAYAYHSNSMSRSNSTEGMHHASASSHLDDPYAHAYHAKRSAPPSPQYTNPASPNHSGYDSCSDTPGHTPAITPAHSPRLRAESVQLPGIRALSLGKQGNMAHPHSSMGRLNVPDTLEPVADVQQNTSHTNLVNSNYGSGSALANALHNAGKGMGASAPGSRRTSVNGSPTNLSAQPYSRSLNNSGMRIADIVNHSGDTRTLPVPQQTHTSSMNESSRERTGVQWMLNADEETEKMDES